MDEENKQPDNTNDDSSTFSNVDPKDRVNVNDDLDDPVANDDVPENIGEYDEESYPDGVDDEDDPLPNPSSFTQSEKERKKAEEELE
jgi:hypothetical protein